LSLDDETNPYYRRITNRAQAPRNNIVRGDGDLYSAKGSLMKESISGCWIWALPEDEELANPWHPLND
jgi:hypothetical protein